MSGSASSLALRPASKDSLRCDSVTSEDYLEISNAPEPLRLLNRYRELCRIFRVGKCNGFVARTLLRHAWAEIHNQLTVIRTRRKVLEQKQQQKQLQQQGRGGAGAGMAASSSQMMNNRREPSVWWAEESTRAGGNGNVSGSGVDAPGRAARTRVVAPGETGPAADLLRPLSESPDADMDYLGDAAGDEQAPLTVTGETPKPSRSRAALDALLLAENIAQQQANSASATAGADQAGLPMYLPYAWRASLTKLDLSRTYLGPRGIVAVCALVAEMPWITELDLSHAAWFVCDERPNLAPTGEEVLRAVVLLLAAHPSLEVLRLDGNMFTTASYVWLLDLCKRNANFPLREISLKDTLLEPFQREHIAGVLARNAARRAKYSQATQERSDDAASSIRESASSGVGSGSSNVVTGSAAAQRVLASGATTHRRGWNYLVTYVTAHPDVLRWSVLVARELSVSVAPATAGALGTLVPSSASASGNSPRSPSQSHRSPSKGQAIQQQTQQQQQRAVPHPSQQSLVYVMSGLSPNVMPGAAPRESVLPHPFTAETCRFLLSPELQQALESVMKCNPLLSQLDDAGRLELMQRGRIVKRTGRSVVMETADPVDFVYVVLHGGLEIRGRPQVLAAASAAATSPSEPSSAANSLRFSASTTLKQKEGTAATATGGAESSVRSSSNNGGGAPPQRENVQQYFASPTIYPAGALVGGEELMSPHITAQAERRVATFVATPCHVLPPVLCRRALIRQSISIDPAKADAVMSNLPLADACYANEKLLERANQELEYATSQRHPQLNGGRSGSDAFTTSGLTKALSASMDSGGGDGSNNSAALMKQLSMNANADVYRGERAVTVDDDGEALEMEAGDGNALRMERLRQLYGVQSGAALRKLEHDTHQARVYNSHELRHEIEARHQQQKHVGDDFKHDHDSLTVLLLIPRDAFVGKLLSQVREQRRQWAGFLDSLPSLVTVPTAFKLALSDCIRRRQYTQGELVSAGFPLLDLVFVVVEGQASVYFQRSEVKRLGRGDIFACHPKTDVSRVSVVVTHASASAPTGSAASGLFARRASTVSGGGSGGSGAVSQLVLGVIAPTFAATLPIGLQRYLLRLRRIYSMASDPRVAEPDGS